MYPNSRAKRSEWQLTRCSSGAHSARGTATRAPEQWLAQAAAFVADSLGSRLNAGDAPARGLRFLLLGPLGRIVQRFLDGVGPLGLEPRTKGL